ncbi:MAG: hypothetical protein JXA33_23530 [Anaerolineae bacterium]|nr:hypothetical protein [Anaerolineae bacterium]
MTYQDLVLEVKKLPLDEQLSLMETLLQCISHRTRSRNDVPQDSLARIRGMLKPVGPMPTDAELTRDYICQF